MKTRLLLLMALSLLPLRAISGPDDTTKHLMKDSVSMLDFGLLSLNLFLKGTDYGSAKFDWDKNRIYIQRFFPESETADMAEKTCASWVSKVRKRAGIIPDTGKPYFETSFFAGYFRHNGFVRKPEPETLYQDIDDLFVLTCSGYGYVAQIQKGFMS